MGDLRRKYFPTATERAEDMAHVEEGQREMVERQVMLRDWATAKGAVEFKRWLEIQIERHDVPSAESAQLLIDSGVRSGLRSVVRQLDFLASGVDS